MIAGLGFLVGAFAAPASLHLLNWMANLQGKLAQAMLGRKELAAGEAAAPAVAEAPAEAVVAEQPEEVETVVKADPAPEAVDEETPEK